MTITKTFNRRSMRSFYLRYRFWLLDWLHGSPIRKPYNDVKYISEHNIQQGSAIKDTKLKELLLHAQAHTQFYKDINSLDLKDYPVMNKALLIEHHSEIVVPIEHIPGQRGDVYVQKTSGSTGVPLEIPQDTRKRERRIAELKYFGKLVGFNTHELLIHLRIWNKWQTKSLKQIRKENIIPFDISNMGGQKMEELCDLIKREKVYAIRGYASIIDNFVNYVIAHPVIFPSLRIIISVSETLQDETREKVKKYIGCEIISQYANEECGIIAEELPPTQATNNKMYFNQAGYYFEVLNVDSDTPVGYGELGRIIMTDLHNYAFPIIRYDTGDLGVFLPPDEKSNGYPVLGKLFGRRLDVCYTTSGEPFNSMLLSRTLKYFDKILQWQFIQKDEKEYCLKIILKEDVSINKYLKDAIDNLKSTLGADAQITIERVDEIPVLASRKRKPVVNEWKNK